MDIMKTKKKWIRSLKGVATYNLLYMVLGIILAWHFSSSDENKFNECLIEIGTTLFALLWVYVCYHCAYKKHGNKFLTIVLLINGSNVVRGISPLMEDFDMFSAILFVAYTGIFIWFLLCSLELREVNKGIKKLMLQE